MVRAEESVYKSLERYYDHARGNPGSDSCLSGEGTPYSSVNSEGCVGVVRSETMPCLTTRRREMMYDPLDIDHCRSIYSPMLARSRTCEDTSRDTPWRLYN